MSCANAPGDGAVVFHRTPPKTAVRGQPEAKNPLFTPGKHQKAPENGIFSLPNDSSPFGNSIVSPQNDIVPLRNGIVPSRKDIVAVIGNGPDFQHVGQVLAHGHQLQFAVAGVVAFPTLPQDGCPNKGDYTPDSPLDAARGGGA